MGFLLLTDGTVITLDKGRRILKETTIAIQDGKIEEIGDTAALKSKYRGAEIVNAHGKIVLPGLIDTHVHLTQTLARGLTNGVSVPDWLYKRILPYEAAMTPNDVYYSSALACLEMIRTGTTCFADPGGYQMEHACRAVEDSGIRGVLAIASVDKQDHEHPLPDGILVSTTQSIRENEDLIRSYNDAADGRIRIWAALRGMLNVTQELILRLNALAKKYHTGIEVHAAFWKDNVAWVKKQTGLTDVRYLDSLGVLGPHWLMIHMGWVDEDEIKILSNRGVKISYCPGPAMKMPLGTNVNKRIPLMIKNGVPVSLGCDSTAANDSLDMFRAMWLNAVVHREINLDPMLMTAEQSLEMATVNGARCLLWEDEIGSIEAGKNADVIIVNPKRPNFAPIHDFSLVSNLVYSGDGHDVETVLVGGRIVMEDRKFTLIDENKVLEEAQKASERINEGLEYKIQPTWPVA